MTNLEDLGISASSSCEARVEGHGYRSWTAACVASMSVVENTLLVAM